jgi:hypothetical protein
MSTSVPIIEGPEPAETDYDDQDQDQDQDNEYEDGMTPEENGNIAEQ